MAKENNSLKNVIQDMGKFNIYDALIPLNWGVWNTIAALLSLASANYYKFIWISLMSTATIIHFALYNFAKRKKGYVLFQEKIIKWLWLIIIIAVIETTFILYALMGISNPAYNKAFVLILVGTGLCITGLIAKFKATLIAGFIWIITANFYIMYDQYVFQIHAILSFVTLILLPLLYAKFGITKYAR